MELDDLKRDWESINKHSDMNTKLNAQIIDKVIAQKYQSNLKKIIIPELIGDAICLLSAIYVGANLNKLDTVFFKTIGIMAILLLTVLPILSIMSVRKFKFKENVNEPIVEMLAKFSIQKKQFYNFQRVNLILSNLLLVFTIILIPKLFAGNNWVVSKNYWIYSFSVSYIFLLFSSKWVMRNYNKTLQKTEDLLQSLDS